VLASISKKLNKASDIYTQELQVIESELGQLGVGLAVTHGSPLIDGDLQEILDDGDGSVVDRYRDNYYLGYGKHWNEWKLLVRKFREYEDTDETITRSVLLDESPLLQSSRELRMAAAEQIEALLKLVTNHANDKLDALNKVIDTK
jgi:hypothetical protein